MNSGCVHCIQEGEEVENFHFGGSLLFQPIFSEHTNEERLEGNTRLERIFRLNIFEYLHIFFFFFVFDLHIFINFLFFIQVSRCCCATSGQCCLCQGLALTCRRCSPLLLNFSLFFHLFLVETPSSRVGITHQISWLVDAWRRIHYWNHHCT